MHRIVVLLRLGLDTWSLGFHVARKWHLMSPEKTSIRVFQPGSHKPTCAFSSVSDSLQKAYQSLTRESKRTDLTELHVLRFK